MVQLLQRKTKTLHVRPNGRSADYITPNFIYGCAGGCRNSYCYVMRHNYESIYVNENIDQILGVIEKHIAGLPEKQPNQTDDRFWTYDIGCSTDVSLHWKHTGWLKVFEFFTNHPRAKGTFATKYVTPKMLDFNPMQKMRIRFSLMPDAISQILEPKTTPISKRIQAINAFVEAGYEVHLNFSPIVAYEGWLDDYARLFDDINEQVRDDYKAGIRAECIFLTHNAQQHERNLSANREQSESLIWMPNIQEGKISEYGGQAVRYRAKIKRNFIERWSQLHEAAMPWNTVRYIF